MKNTLMNESEVNDVLKSLRETDERLVRSKVLFKERPGKGGSRMFLWMVESVGPETEEERAASRCERQNIRNGG